MSTHNGRDDRGRFAQGNGGRPLGVRNRVAVLREALEASVTPEQVAAVMRKLFALAEAGSVRAIRIFLEYAVGKPTQPVELLTTDAQQAAVDAARRSLGFDTDPLRGVGDNGNGTH